MKKGNLESHDGMQALCYGAFWITVALAEVDPKIGVLLIFFTIIIHYLQSQK